MQFSYVIPEFRYVVGQYNSHIAENEYGKWTTNLFVFTEIEVNRCTKIAICILFNPSKKYKNMNSDEDIKINLKFIKADNAKYSISNKFNLKMKHFHAYSSFNFYNLRSGSYLVSVKIDTSSFPLPIQNNSQYEHLKNMLETQSGADITIKSSTGEFKAHKFMLVRSKVFHRMLSNSYSKEAQTGVITITDIEHDTLFEMVRYLYTNDVPRIKELALELLYAANKYDIPGLVHECGNYMVKNISRNNFADILIAADDVNLQSLKEKIFQFIIAQRDKLVELEKWEKLKLDHKHLIEQAGAYYFSTL